MNNPMTYIQNGDYLIPDLKLSQQPEKPLGKYGRMRKTYLKEHHPILYNQMLLSEKLFQTSRGKEAAVEQGRLPCPCMAGKSAAGKANSIGAAISGSG